MINWKNSVLLNFWTQKHYFSLCLFFSRFLFFFSLFLFSFLFFFFFFFLFLSFPFFFSLLFLFSFSFFLFSFFFFFFFSFFFSSFLFFFSNQVYTLIWILVINWKDSALLNLLTQKHYFLFLNHFWCYSSTIFMMFIKYNEVGVFNWDV